jgi:hypothetical protein
MAQLQATGVSGSLAISGSVGVGIASPARTLHVVGQAAFDMSTAGVVVQDSSSISQIVSYKQTGATYHDLHLRGANLGIAISGSNGFVGIGTASPSQALQIGDGTASKYIRVYTNNGDTYFGSDSIGAIAGTANSVPMYFITNNTERMRITSGGNVGIGTTSPSVLLHLNTTDTVGNIFRISNGTQQLNLGVNNSGGGSYVFESASQALRFGTSDTERMRIGANGNIAIGDSPVLSTSDLFGALALGKSGTDKVVIG